MSIDVVQDKAVISFVKPGLTPSLLKLTNVHVTCPLPAIGEQPGADLRHATLEQARAALQEAIRILDHSPA
ncbi:hypothetical protein ABLE91_02400 [Aquabacter sp. CN5-332]|uniref:hypothetical protein n=1 Tax=Aquabacter sp. CN5-332 TaxID=3156608 RepID=UPI0032B424AD